jgi:hypothetical protein
MKNLIFTLLFLVCFGNYSYAQDGMKPEIIPNMMTVELVRSVGRDVFNANGIKFLQPVVEAMNSTSNSRFYNQAFIPQKDSLYFKLSLNSMVGFIPDNKKSYVPELPNEKATFSGMLKYIKITDVFNFKYTITDTAGLIRYAFRGMLYDGIRNKQITVPSSAPTALGKGDVKFDLPPDSLKKIFRNMTMDSVPILGSLNVYNTLPQALRDSIDNILAKFPSAFTLPPGSNISTIIAGIPQLEIGSFLGTELLLRYVPKINMGSTIGKFSFFGFGLKHSISQYFNDGDKLDSRYFDLALQIVYQGTSLENTIGVMGAQLKSNAQFWDINIHGSKTLHDELFGGTFDIYTGVSLDLVSIKSTYKTYLPIVMQWDLGLIDERSDYTPNYLPSDGRDGTPNLHPGDQFPQTAAISLNDNNYKWIIGINKKIGPVSIYLDYNVSKFNIFTGGIEYRF